MMHSKNSFGLIILLFVFSSCGDKKGPSEPESLQPGNVKGNIYKSNTQIPIPGARVSVDHIVYTTGNDGFYILTDVPIGRRILKVEKTNFERFEETIEVSEGTKTKDVYLVSLIKQRLYGEIFNKKNSPISDATITVDGKTQQTNINGEFEFPDLIEGNYNITVEHNDYEKYEQSFTMPEGEKELNIYLTAMTLSQISSVALADRPNGIFINWPDINSSVIESYNVYFKNYLGHTLYGEISGQYITPVYSSWEKANLNPIIQSDYLIAAEDYNAGYGIYVLPVNIDGLETPFSDNDTKIKYLHMDSNYNTLTSFTLTDSHGPVEIPNNSNEIAIRLRFKYSQANLFQPSDWTVQVSSNGVSWTTVGTNGLSVFGSLLPERDAGYIKHFSLNQYKGQSIYFRTNPNSFGSPSMSITNQLREYIY